MADNPYATPESTELRASATVDREQAIALRARLRGTERLVRSIGLVYFGQALVALTMAALLLSPVIQGAHSAPLPLLSSAIYLIFLTALQAVAGYGLITLATWSRLCALFQTFYLLAGFTFGLFALAIDTHAGFVFAILHSLPFYILFGPRAGYVLSPGYAAIVSAAPGRVGGSALLAVLIAVVFVMLIAADVFVLAQL